jgi:photosystem II stability/assembly factor-like uncharacterized protein
MSRSGWRILAAAIVTLTPLLLARVPVAAAAPWQPRSDGLPFLAPVLTVGADPDQPGLVWAGTNSRPGLWCLRGEGGYWQPIADSPPTYTFLWDAGRQTWWAGTAGGLLRWPAGATRWQAEASLAGPVLDLALDSSGRLYAVRGQQGLMVRSTAADPADTWAALQDEPQALSIAVSPSGRDLYLGTAGSGLWVSHDGGGQWTQVSETGDDYVATVLVATQHGAVVARGQGQAYHSLDGGYTWDPVPGLPDRPRALALAPGGELFAGQAGGIARSGDAGRTWDLGGEGLPVGSAVASLAFSRTEDRAAGVTLFAAAGQGVYRSHDGGQTFERCDAGLGSPEVKALASDGSGGLVAATWLGLYRRPADEDTWQPVTADSDVEPVDSLARHEASGLLYAGTQGGLLRSRDGGATWEDITTELTAHGVPGVLVDPADPEHLYIRLSYERVYESHDGGVTWTARWEGMALHDVVLSMAYTPAGELWAGTQDGLFHWDQAAARWQREPAPGTQQSVFTLAFDPEGGRLYAGASTGLWVRAASGEWQHCPGAPDQTITALAVLPSGQIYAGTRNAGPGYGSLYHTNDGGATWQPVPGVPAGASVHALLLDEAEPGALYAATSAGAYHGTALPCPSAAPANAPTGNGWAVVRDQMTWARQLTRARTYPPVQHLPAVHTLHADNARLQQARDLGAQAIVQVFSWYEIQPSREHWHWQVPDFTVRAADYYGLDLIVRLDQPPEWALPGDGVPAEPPFDTEAYLTFVETVAGRYRGQIRAYIVWNEPNLAQEWGAPPDPEAYAHLLQRAYLAIKRADPVARVVSAGLAPTNEQSERALDDRLYLARMLQAGALPCLDALGAHPYGFAHPPEDPWGAHDGLNMNRLLDLQAILADHGGASTPIWATEAGWTTAASGEAAGRAVTPQRQADYLVRAWEMAGTAFPTLEVWTVWNLSAGLPPEDEMAGYSLLAQDGRPKPAFAALQRALDSTADRRPEFDLWAVADRLLTRAAPVPILAPDAEVHLGDSE